VGFAVSGLFLENKAGNRKETGNGKKYLNRLQVIGKAIPALPSFFGRNEFKN